MASEQKIGHYTILEEIGQGGTGTVCRGIDEQSGRLDAPTMDIRGPRTEGDIVATCGYNTRSVSISIAALKRLKPAIFASDRCRSERIL